jgi:beta-galactosidase
MPAGRLTVRDRAFHRDGQPHRIVSGALHYFRIHPELWRDRLARAQALGLNTVETYVPWNWHERQRGRTRFDGWADVQRFVELAGGLGLDVILRPGPYICAEWDFGGLPAWLLRDGPARLRCADPAFLAAVDRWFDELVPRIVPLQSSRGGPVVAVQVENEYGSFGDDRAYLRFCRDGLRRRGIDVLLVTSDGAGPDYLASGTVDGALPTVNFGSRPQESLGELQAFDPAAPAMVMELWAGWSTTGGNRTTGSRGRGAGGRRPRSGREPQPLPGQRRDELRALERRERRGRRVPRHGDELRLRRRHRRGR